MRKAVSFGIPENEAVLAATDRPAVSLGREKEMGSVAPGRHADFVLCTDALERLAVYMSGENFKCIIRSAREMGRGSMWFPSTRWAGHMAASCLCAAFRTAGVAPPKIHIIVLNTGFSHMLLLW